ncbi:MAG: 23S rRNA (guanosine(2251)-2'-O)-methyltransferase RlmB [Chloroflexia bacterium]
MATGALVQSLYGRNAVREALRAGRRRFFRLLLAEGMRRDEGVEELERLASARGCPVEYRPRGTMAQVARSREHQGVVLEAGPYPYAELEEILAAAQEAGRDALVLLLDRVQDPQNLGTLLRTAEAVGAQGVVLPEHEAAGVTPAVVRASAGACEHLAIARVTNLARALAALQKAGLWVVGLESDAQATLYTQIDWDRPLALVVGSEGFGLRRLIRERCDILARLPMRGQVSSLNAAVAGSVALYEILRYRDALGHR